MPPHPFFDIAGLDLPVPDLRSFKVGVLKQIPIPIDNDTLSIDSVRLWAMGVDMGTRGSIYYDDFDKKRIAGQISPPRAQVFEEVCTP